MWHSHQRKGLEFDRSAGGSLLASHETLGDTCIRGALRKSFWRCMLINSLKATGVRSFMGNVMQTAESEIAY